MKILILGAGVVGSSVAENLSGESNDITIIDRDAERLNILQDKLDVRTIVGGASHPDVLERAGAKDIELLIAVTSSDEVNIIACQIAYSLFHVPTKIARVRDQGYLSHPELFTQESLPVDVIISPEQLVTDYVRKLIEYPGSLQVLDFARGKVTLVAVKAYFSGPMVGSEIQKIREHMPDVDTRVAAIFRDGTPIQPIADTVIESGDEVFFISAKENIRAVMSELRRLDRPVKNVMVVGGGNIGKRLAEALEHQYNVKLIEKFPDRCRHLSESLKHTLVLQGDGADEELLTEESIEAMDVFVAVTNDDEANILSSMLAKKMGASRVMSLINRAAYVELLEGSDVDVVISPKLATISKLLAHVRHGDVVAVHSLRRGAAEAIEAVAHGDKRTSRVIGRAICEINLPPGTTIGAIVREEDVLIAHHDMVIQAGDHVILFLIDKRHIAKVEKLFEVNIKHL